MNKYLLVGAFAALCVACSLSFAKGRQLPSSSLANTTQAREFYITFPTNIVDPGVTPNVLDLTCFIASNYNTKGTIQILGTGNTIIWQQNFAVDAQGVTQIGIPHQYNNQAEIQDAEDERAITKAVYITTDMPCVVYGMSHRPFTADGYLAIPPSSWGTDYRIGGYYGVSTTSEAALTKLDVTSELAVVAAQDSTVVNIILSAPTRDINNNMTHRAGDLVSVILNKGQIYQMQSYSDPGGGNYYDLSMTEIQSSKPVGVLGGSKCANVPISYYACDYVIEMMPPIQSWGKEFFTYQFDPARRGGDLWRVYPSQAGTVVTVNGAARKTISPTDSVPWYEIDDLRDSTLKNPAHWIFNKPVMMVQYITSEQYDGSDQLNPPRGDPSSVVLESREQFHTNIFCALPADSNGYTNQYLNIFINNEQGPLKDSLYIDGYDIQHLPGQSYALLSALQVPGTNYWALHIQVPGGMHRLQAKSPFSAYAVGFKDYESYAWPCGLSLNVLGTGDTKPPVLTNNALDCGTANDTLTDQPDIDSIRSNLAQAGDDSSGIGWVHQGPYPDTTYNFNEAVLPLTFNPGDSTTRVHFQVTDLRNKAHGAFYAIDRASNDTTYYFDYTPDSVTVTPDTMRYGGGDLVITIDSTVIENPLNRNVNIDSVWLVKGKNYKIISNDTLTNFTLLPGEKRTIVVKFIVLSDTASDTLMVKFDCFSRPIAVLKAFPPNAVNEPGLMPQDISLDQNAPNPFSTMTNFDYRIPTGGFVTLNVYDALGRKVATLADGFVPNGEHTATFNAAGLPAGVYIARLQAGGAIVRRMMQIVR